MNRILLLLTFLSVFIFSSCLMRKIEYVKDMTPDSLYKIKSSEVLKIQPKDRLSITVHSKNIELSAPFNTDIGGYSLATESDIIKGINADETFEKGYLVDSDGNINFPVLGKIKVSGLSTDEIKNHIANLIIQNNYINDPLVKVNLLNFKVMTMGTITNKVLTVVDGKMTLIEAIVLSGGLTPNSDASKVMVIREEGGDRKMIVANLEKYDVFNSEGFDLRQNDIVYVAPKYKQVTPGTQSVWQTVGMLFGVISLGISAWAISSRR